MGATSFIPAGRTSLVKHGSVSMQVQTEYASRPRPRITTTILKEGQVVHKIERPLDRAIESIDEQQRAEATIKRQHAEVVSIVQSESYARDNDQSGHVKAQTATLSTVESIQAINDVERVFRMDNEGNFIGGNVSDSFRKQFAPVLKGVSEIMGVFGRMPGVGISRKKGVLEIERDRLYFASGGTECYFILVHRIDRDTDFEGAIKAVITQPE
jgi:hypothetical protein